MDKARGVPVLLFAAAFPGECRSGRDRTGILRVLSAPGPLVARR